MGAVWLAQDELLDREVAVKQVVSTAGMTEDTATEMRQRAMREGRIAARLSHRNAIAMYDVALDRGEPWLVMEYLPSRSLAQVLHMTGTMPEGQVAQIGAQIADALAEAHDSGIIHRDVKPGNILIANRGRQSGIVKLTDFGISRAKDDVQLTQTGVITGTPAYFAPEVARGDEPAETADLYSLGATLYTAIEGVPPFGADENSLVLLHKVARGQINPPTHRGPLMDVVLSMLEPDPARRPTLAQARDRLAAVAAGGGNAAGVLASPLQQADGATPVWMRRAPGREGRTSDSAYMRPVAGPGSPSGFGPGGPPSGARPSGSIPGTGMVRPLPPHPSNPRQFPVAPPPQLRPKNDSLSPAALATAIILAFIAVAAVAAIVIVLINR